MTCESLGGRVERRDLRRTRSAEDGITDTGRTGAAGAGTKSTTGRGIEIRSTFNARLNAVTLWRCPARRDPPRTHGLARVARAASPDDCALHISIRFA